MKWSANINHHIMHLLVGFIGDPAEQLNTSANSGELTTARALQACIISKFYHVNIFVIDNQFRNYIPSSFCGYE